MGKKLSIEIDNQNIKILEGGKKGSLLTVYKSIFLDTPLNSFDDGKIINMEAVVNTIKKALKENKIRTKNTVIIINSNLVLTRNIELPILKKHKETLSMIKIELEQLLSVDLDNYKIIYKQIEKFTTVDELEKSKYIVYGLPVSIYNNYIELTQRLRLQIMALDLSLNSLDKITEHKLTINRKKIEENSATAFIDFGFSNITFSVVNNGKNDFSRISTNGVKDVIRSFATVYGLTQDEAFEEFDNISLIENDENVEGLSKLNLLEQGISVWTDEFNRYIRYYNSLNKDRQIRKIYTYGTYFKNKDLAQYLSSRLNIEVEKINELSGLTVRELPITKLSIVSNFNSILSLYIQKRDVNFLTDKNKKRTKKFSVNVFLMAAILITAITAAYYAYDYFVEQWSLQKELDTMNQFMLNEDNIKLNSDGEIVKNNLNILQEYKKQVDILTKAIENEDSVTTIMFGEVGKATPIGTKVNSITIDKQNMQLQCTSSSRLEVAQFEKNLKQIEFINYVYIPAILESAEGANTAFNYSVFCELKDVSVNETE